MENSNEEEFFFCAPVEENDEIPIELDEKGDYNPDSADSVPVSPTTNFFETASRIIYKKTRKSQSKSTDSDPDSNIFVVDDSKKPFYVSGLLEKLRNICEFDEAETSLSFWRTLAFLLSNDEGENYSTTAALAFAQNGGIALAARTMQNFLVRCRDTVVENSSFQILVEVMRCISSVYSTPSIITFDMDWIPNNLGAFIDLGQWVLISKDEAWSAKFPKNLSIQAKVKLGPISKKDEDKITMLFPSIRAESDATNFDSYSIDFLADNAEGIVDEALVWTLKPSTESPKESKTPDGRSINLVAQMNPVTFLATGDRKSDILSAVSSAIGSNQNKVLQPVKLRPFCGSVYMVQDTGENTGSDYYRALVTSFVVGKPEVVVFAIDYGFTKTVQIGSLRQLPEEMTKIKPAVFICFIRDAVPAPNPVAFKEALNVFISLSSQKSTTHSFLKRNVVEALLLILRLNGQDAIVEQALKILTNLSVPCIVDRNLILESGGLEQLFLLGAELVEKAVDNASLNALLLLVLQCLSNLVKYNDAARRKLVYMKGAILPNFILSHFDEGSPINEAATNLVNALVTRDAASEDIQEKMNQWSARSQPQECSALNKLLLDSLKVKGGKVSYETPFTPEMLKNLCSPVKQTDEDILKPNAMVQEILRRISVPWTAGRSYSQNEKIVFPDDGRWYEICDDITNLHQLKTRRVQELCCAALNSRQRLTIYFGLDNDGSVRGINVSEWEVDEFRLGIDWSLSRALRPFLEPAMYHVEFVPVCVGEHQPKRIPNLYVVELQIMHFSTQAYQLEKDGSIFYRINGNVVELNLQEASEFIAYRKRKEEEMNLLRLRRQIAIMKAALAGGRG